MKNIFYNLKKSEVIKIPLETGHALQNPEQPEYRQFFATVSIGAPEHDFKVAIDLTSTDLWVPSKTCSSSLATGFACFNHEKYDHRFSKTYEPDGTNFTGWYPVMPRFKRSGEVAGFASVDKVSIGGQALTAKFAEVTDFQGVGFLLGLRIVRRKFNKLRQLKAIRANSLQ